MGCGASGQGAAFTSNGSATQQHALRSTFNSQHPQRRLHANDGDRAMCCAGPAAAV